MVDVHVFVAFLAGFLLAWLGFVWAMIWIQRPKDSPIVIPSAESRALPPSRDDLFEACRELLCWTAGMGGRVKRARYRLMRVLEHHEAQDRQPTQREEES